MMEQHGAKTLLNFGPRIALDYQLHSFLLLQDLRNLAFAVNVPTLTDHIIDDLPVLGKQQNANTLHVLLFLKLPDLLMLCYLLVDVYGLIFGLPIQDYVLRFTKTKIRVSETELNFNLVNPLISLEL